MSFNVIAINYMGFIDMVAMVSVGHDAGTPAKVSFGDRISRGHLDRPFNYCVN